MKALQVGKGMAHIQMTPQYLMDRIEERGAEFAGECVRHSGGRPASLEEAMAYLRKMIADGYEVIPCGCEGTDAKGRCPGWR